MDAPSGFSQKRCSVCQKALSTFQQAPYFAAQTSSHERHGLSEVSSALYSCGSFECKNILDKKHQMSAPQFAAFFDFQRKCIQKNKEDAALNEKRRLEKIADCLAENDHLYKKAINSFSLKTGSYPLLPLPSCWREEIKQKNTRADEFSKHLRKLLDAAIKPDYDYSHDERESRKKSLLTDQLLNSNPAMETLVIRACTLCKGGCCTQGGNHAYLSAGNLYRFMQAHQFSDAEDIISAYIDKVPAQSIENSCLFHTSKGCNLPRDMRSDICNGYLCNGLKKVHKNHYQPQEKSDSTEPDGFIAVVHVQDNWQASDSLESNPANYVGVLQTSPNA